MSVDVTESVRFAERLRAMPEFDGASVGPTLIAAWALCGAVRRHPRINATWDEAAGEIVVKHYVNLGIAAATPRGLLVPNVKHADRLDLAALGRALKRLTTTARDGATAPAELAGG
ncbi:2-oxo acid dehydrogenase subunit E2, partial [Xanthomonas citri pv. citri]